MNGRNHPVPMPSRNRLSHEEPSPHQSLLMPSIISSSSTEPRVHHDLQDIAPINHVFGRLNHRFNTHFDSFQSQHQMLPPITAILNSVPHIHSPENASGGEAGLLEQEFDKSTLEDVSAIPLHVAARSLVLNSSSADSCEQSGGSRSYWNTVLSPKDASPWSYNNNLVPPHFDLASIVHSLPNTIERRTQGPQSLSQNYEYNTSSNARTRRNSAQLRAPGDDDLLNTTGTSHSHASVQVKPYQHLSHDARHNRAPDASNLDGTITSLEASLSYSTAATSNVPLSASGSQFHNTRVGHSLDPATGRIEKKHKCDACDLSFQQKGGLRAHINSVHKQLRPFLCDWVDCKKAYKAKGDLNRHVRAMHFNEKPYECTFPGCLCSFSRKSTLERHIENVHMKKV